MANPADRMIYCCMEAMQFAIGNFRSYGGTLQRAVRVVDRSAKEIGRGVYGATARIPAHGRYPMALLLGTPRVLHCLEFSAKPNPAPADPDAGRPRLVS